MDSLPLPSREDICRSLGFRPDGIADLSALGLSAEAIEARKAFIGGSDATIIAKGEPQPLCDLADFKRGQRAPDDLSGLLHVQLGSWTEPFILAWAERELDARFTRRGERVHYELWPVMAATLDGFLPDYRGRGSRVVQAKHVNAFSQLDDVAERYRAQVTHEAACAGADGTLLVILCGTQKFEIFDFELDLDYLGELVEAEQRFWAAVQNGVDPAPRPVKTKAPPPVRAERKGEIDMRGNNEWGAQAATWLATRDAAQSFAAATDALKKLVPAGAARAYGAGVEAKASKAGAISIKPLTAQTDEPQGDA